MSFSDSTYVEFPFGLSSDPSFLRGAIFSAIQEGGSTRLAGALNSIVSDVLENFQAAGRRSIVIYVASGVSVDSASVLTSAISNLKSTGTETFIVAVGSSVSQSELEQLSTQIYTATSYSEIGTLSFANQFLDAQCVAVTASTGSTSMTPTCRQ